MVNNNPNPPCFRGEVTGKQLDIVAVRSESDDHDYVTLLYSGDRTEISANPYGEIASDVAEKILDMVPEIRDECDDVVATFFAVRVLAGMDSPYGFHLPVKAIVDWYRASKPEIDAFRQEHGTGEES